MSFSFKLKNPGKVTANMVRRSKKFRTIAIRNYTLAADVFIQEIRAEYYSGQRGERGVNKITTDLHRNWFPDIQLEDGNLVATIHNSMNYAEVHEFGSSTHDKRTDVTGEMLGGFGNELFVKAAKDALKEAF